MMRRFLALSALLAALGFLGNAACAADASAPASHEAAPIADDPVTEKRLQSLSAELRCLVCQNQTIADSHADLAVDLRREIRGMIQAGQTDQQIIDFMVARYGDFVLYRPPLKTTTAILWGGPALLLLVGLFGLIHHLRRRNATAVEPAPLSADDAARAAALLKSTDSQA
jgi:cytochrome c-type biogenesis protein CcmH